MILYSIIFIKNIVTFLLIIGLFFQIFVPNNVIFAKESTGSTLTHTGSENILVSNKVNNIATNASYAVFTDPVSPSTRLSSLGFPEKVNLLFMPTISEEMMLGEWRTKSENETPIFTKKALSLFKDSIFSIAYNATVRQNYKDIINNEIQQDAKKVPNVSGANIGFKWITEQIPMMGDNIARHGPYKFMYDFFEAYYTMNGGNFRDIEYELVDDMGNVVQTKNLGELTEKDVTDYIHQNLANLFGGFQEVKENADNLYDVYLKQSEFITNIYLKDAYKSLSRGIIFKDLDPEKKYFIRQKTQVSGFEPMQDVEVSYIPVTVFDKKQFILADKKYAAAFISAIISENYFSSFNEKYGTPMITISTLFNPSGFKSVDANNFFDEMYRLSNFSDKVKDIAAIIDYEMQHKKYIKSCSFNLLSSCDEWLQGGINIAIGEHKYNIQEIRKDKNIYLNFDIFDVTSESSPMIVAMHQNQMDSYEGIKVGLYRVTNSDIPIEIGAHEESDIA